MYLAKLENMLKSVYKNESPKSDSMKYNEHGYEQVRARIAHQLIQSSKRHN